MNSNTKIVEYQGQKFEVPATTKGAELSATFGLHDGSTLYARANGHEQVIKDADVIEVAPGQQFESVGRFVAAGKNVARINRELHYLLSEYGEARVYWPPAHQWVMIQDFPLPRGWSPSKTDIVILIPDNYGNGAPLRDCFVDADLRFRHNGKWQKIGHYFDTPGGYTVDSEFRDIGWRYLCLHMQDWRPEYTFFSYLKVIRVYLSNPYHSWPGN